MATMSRGDATSASQTFQKTKEGINRNYRGFGRKLRLIIAEAEYALALYEGGLGAESVAENWKKHFEKLWRARHAPETANREALLHALVNAERNYSEPGLGWERPRETFRTYVGEDVRGQVMSILLSVPFEDEAAARGIESVAQFDPESAAMISRADLAALIPPFRDRHQNLGRRGKDILLDLELCKLVRKMGLTPVTPEAMRRHRLRFEEKMNLRRAEELRARHLEALRLEREQHGL